MRLVYREGFRFTCNHVYELAFWACNERKTSSVSLIYSIQGARRWSRNSDVQALTSAVVAPKI